jgi:hypothetical protein
MLQSEETAALGVPCVTLRENTERPVTTEMGTNIQVGTKKESILNAYKWSIEKRAKGFILPPKWDGRASEQASVLHLCPRSIDLDIALKSRPFFFEKYIQSPIAIMNCII